MEVEVIDEAPMTRKRLNLASTANQQSINMKITKLTEKLNILLENTISGSTIYTMAEKINFMKLTQTHFHNLIFEQELFTILLKNKYAINNNESTSTSWSSDENSSTATTTYANTEYPFSLIICSGDALRSSILVNNVGLVLIKFILYLRMLNQLVGRADSPGCLLATNMNILPFGRVCIDVDYKGVGDESNEQYEAFVKECFRIVCEYTTVGNILMTQNCYTPNTRSFHLIAEQHFDAATRQVVFAQIAEGIKTDNIKIDRVHVWMLPFGRGHVPVRKYVRKTNEFVELGYPYAEEDFELAMPFDLTTGMDNLYTLLSYGESREDEEQEDEIHEYLDDEIVQTYSIIGVRNIPENLQLYVKVSSFKYDFAFQSRYTFRFKYNYLPRVLGHIYNNYFLIMSNRRLLFENNWQIPKPKINKRPMEFYEIYRFISHKFTNDLQCMGDLFQLIPQTLARKNVNIGNVDQLLSSYKRTSLMDENQRNINAVHTGNMRFNFSFDTAPTTFNSIHAQLRQPDDMHPWAYLVHSKMELMPVASVYAKHTYEFFRKTIVDNVYAYEKSEVAMLYFRNIQSILANQLGNITKEICKAILVGDVQQVQNYMFPMYEFFCRVHYIDSCLSRDEYNELMEAAHEEETLTLKLQEEKLSQYRKKYVEFTPCPKAYHKFPGRNTPLSKIWRCLSPKHKVILHIIYLMIIEHNYTSVFVYLHNVLKTNDMTYLICSFLLNIIDDGSAYASKEFLNFVFKVFIDAGTNVQCGFEEGNIVFNMTNLQSVITDLQTMFISSPMWFFLANFQYVHENMDFTARFDMFLQIFQQDAYEETNGSGGGSGGGEDQPPPAKQARVSTKSFSPDKYFKTYNIRDTYHDNLLNIFYMHIVSLCRTENGVYIYDGARFCTPAMPIKYTPQIINDPVKYAYIYRHQFGIYNTWTMQYERNTSSFYTQINISTDEFAKYPEIFNAHNDDIYRIMVNRFLKSITFTRVLSYQRNLALMLAPIYDPNIDATKNIETLNYKIDSIQINIHDLSSSDFVLPEEMLHDILQTKTKLYEMFRWLYAIVCHYSETYSCIITTPSSFIPKCMLPAVPVAGATGESVVDSTYSLFQQQMSTGGGVGGDSDPHQGENLIRRIHKILDAKKPEQQENITDELQKLCQSELTSLIILFDDIFKSNEGEEDVINQDAEDSEDSRSSSTVNEDINKINLSTRGGIGESNDLLFYNNDEYIENSKNKLLLNLFDRKLSKDIVAMTGENFQKTIEENFSTHIIRFVLLTLSWFVRTVHVHLFSECLFFRELQQHRQLLYNELCELVFRHNGHFLYNNSISDITDTFGYYCRNTCLSVDPVFEMSFPVPTDLYLGHDAELESRVCPKIIKDIEAGCVSAIYQGQFIEDTNVDLNRLWARVTVPRNKHRISPLFNLHTATGKSEYLAEKCRKQYNNKYHNNFLDSTSLKSSDHRGIDMAPELNANLIVCIEEFSNLGEKFKQICGHSNVTYKPLWADTKSSFQNNATVILATNTDPKCTEAAVIARLHVYPRRIQYANVNKYLKFQRSTVCSTAALLTTNNIFAVQLIMEKMPRVVAENYKGNFMMTWILKRFFLYNITDPVTVQASDTLQYHIDNFHNMINAPQLVMERLEMNTGEMSLFNFRKLINRICDENRNLFHSKIDTYNVFTILSDKLKVMINNEKQTIRVSEKVNK